MTSNNSTEIELHPAPSDGITSLHITDNKFLLASSWDSHVRLYDLQSKTLKSTYQHKAGVLDCCFQDKYRSYSGGLDRLVKVFDTTTSQDTLLGSHDKAVKCVEYNSTVNLLVSGSWDTNIKLWDQKSSNHLIGTFKQPERVYTISSVNETLVVGTASRNIQIYDLRYMDEPLQKRESSLKYQTRMIRCFPNGTGFALSSIEGRVAMEYFDPSPQFQSKKYAFKCHRIAQHGVDTVYPVNALSFNQKFGTFATGGCDGVVNVWDGENKKRLAQFTKYPTSISSVAFSEDATLLAISSSYTFEEGERDHPPDQIFVRNVTEAEVKPKSKGEQ
jgi:cell cycle arrest protein BUB3